MANAQNTHHKAKSSDPKGVQYANTKDTNYCQDRVTVSPGTLPRGVQWA